MPRGEQSGEAVRFRRSYEALLGPEVDRAVVRLNVHQLDTTKCVGCKCGQDAFEGMDETRSVSLTLVIKPHGQHANLKNENSSLGVRGHLHNTKGGPSFDRAANGNDQRCIYVGHVVGGVHIGDALTENVHVLAHRRVLLTTGEERNICVGSSALLCCCKKDVCFDILATCVEVGSRRVRRLLC